MEDLEGALRTDIARAAFRWLAETHLVYAGYLRRHRLWLRSRADLAGLVLVWC